MLVTLAVKCWNVQFSHSDCISCFDKQVKLLHWISICKQYCVFLLLKHFWSSVKSLLCGRRLKWQEQGSVFGCQGSRFVGRWGGGWLFIFYSSDWSMRSCLRTLVWLVSLISPARNISSTTVYTFERRHGKRIRGQEMRRLRQFRLLLVDKYHKPRMVIVFYRRLEGLGFLEKLSYTMLGHHLACGHHYPTPPLSHRNLKITRYGQTLAHEHMWHTNQSWSHIWEKRWLSVWLVVELQNIEERKVLLKLDLLYQPKMLFFPIFWHLRNGWGLWDFLEMRFLKVGLHEETEVEWGQCNFSKWRSVYFFVLKH